jgi:hypothetical protein
MNKVKFSKIPSLIELEKKVESNQNKEFLFETIDDRSFEKMVYWIYRTEIENGSWGVTYDDIQVMSGVREKAQDCCLFLDGKKTGVIQCKHSKKGTSLNESKFAEEIIKFSLYVLTDQIEIVTLNTFKYYIVSSSTFNDK